MASKTEFLGLTKPSLEDFYNIEVFNNNFQKIDGFLKNIGAKIATGSYVGTGTDNADNPSSLTFDFEPKVVFIYATSSIMCGGHGYYTPAVFIRGCYITVMTSNQNYKELYTTWNGNTVSWYDASTSNVLNNPSKTYRYVAIG